MNLRTAVLSLAVAVAFAGAAGANSADGNHVEVRVDSATGKIMPDDVVATISKDKIIVKLQDAGYTNVHDVEVDDGV